MRASRIVVEIADIEKAGQKKLKARDFFELDFGDLVPKSVPGKSWSESRFLKPSDFQWIALIFAVYQLVGLCFGPSMSVFKTPLAGNTNNLFKIPSHRAMLGSVVFVDIIYGQPGIFGVTVFVDSREYTRIKLFLREYSALHPAKQHSQYPGFVPVHYPVASQSRTRKSHSPGRTEPSRDNTPTDPWPGRSSTESLTYGPKGVIIPRKCLRKSPNGQTPFRTGNPSARTSDYMWIGPRSQSGFGPQDSI
ncbi:hypothetical protein B0H11DRAFT_1916522 [Mycena galericulata]|nr:hypothetical protein B0H11DRAFT_1916522 [Mycena galericulata]